MTPTTDRERARGALLGSAVGDALGMPSEDMSPSAIRLEWGEITGFESAPEGRPCEHLSPGQWTDDTQLMLLTAEAMLCSDPVDSFAAALAGWFRDQEDPAAWRYPGTACLTAASRLDGGVPASESGVDGAGCGAAMRIAPVGVALRLEPDRAAVVAAELSAVTHRNPLAVDGAVAVAVVVARLCRGDSFDAAFGDRALLSFLGRPEVGLTLDGLGARARAASLAAAYGSAGPSGWTAHAVPAALHAVLRHRSDFAGAVLDAANGGGDTDSVGAIAGAIAGAWLGVDAIPITWRAAVEDAPRILALADALVSV